MKYSRRTFARLALASLPATAVLGRSAGPAIGELRLGVQTYSFRDMLSTPGDMTDKMVAAMRELGLTECEVFEPTIQPPSLSADAPWRMAAGGRFFGKSPRRDVRRETNVDT